MTPGARVQAAIDILDEIAGGVAAEKALTGWARRSRFAGSKDRAAVRDHVFQALRCWRSYACLGGAETGRGRMIGAQRAAGIDPAEVFHGHGHAPAALTEAEMQAGAVPQDTPDLWDLPDWLVEVFTASLGPAAADAAALLQARAPVTVRVNPRKGTVAEAQTALTRSGIGIAPLPDLKYGLQITDNPRKIAHSDPFQNGLIELQDAASQAAMEAVALVSGDCVLDYCAGGGGKILALAAREEIIAYAHDAHPQRLQDLPVRAARAGVSVQILHAEELHETGPFDLLICDVPCSGSGTWRRSPDAKWRLSPAALDDLVALQRDILSAAVPHVRPGGRLVYTTCSILDAENSAQVEWFRSHFSDWSVTLERSYGLSPSADGFFMAQFKRE